MKAYLSSAALALLIPSIALGQVVTIETTLGDRGYPDGIVLQGQTSANVYIPLPRTAQVRGGKIIVEGRSVMPTLQRGSISVAVNVRPVDAFAPERSDDPVLVRRVIALNDGQFKGMDALNVRFESELRASTDPCTDDFDIANSVVIFPTTQISYDVSIDAVRSIADALAILPHRARVILPSQSTVANDVAAAAIQVGVLLMLRGHTPLFNEVRGNDPVAIRIEKVTGTGPRTPAIRLERDGGRIDIVVDSDIDFAAFGRLLQAAPAALAGERAEVVSARNETGTADDGFLTFAALPPEQRIRHFGEWRINFPLVLAGGRIAESALLKLFMAPDWSGQRSIVTVYLNGQIVAAMRSNPGENTISVPLSASLLRFSNTLRVAIERGGSQQYCAATDRGQSAQLQPGSGLVLRPDIGSGFLRAAASFAEIGEIALPSAASNLSDIHAYLQLSSRILASFVSRPGELSVVFGEPTSKKSRGVLQFETVGQAGLIFAVADQIEKHIKIISSSPIAVLTAEPDGRTIRVQLADARNVPIPSSLYLSGGTKAIVDQSGVVWQSGVRTIEPTFAERLKSHIDIIYDQRMIAFALIAFAIFILLLLFSRAVIKSIFIFRRRAREK